MRALLPMTVVLAVSVPLKADFSYSQTSQVTGGTILNMTRFVPGAGRIREPQTMTVAIKGNKLVTYDQETAMIIDVDAETMTQVNFKDKKYSTITFAEFKQAMAAMAERMKAMQMQMQQQMPPDTPMPEMKISVSETGQTRTISGLNAKQFILTMAPPAVEGAPAAEGSKTTMDSWITPAIPGYEEIQAFYLKMGAKMSDVFTGGANPLAMMRQDVAKAMSEMAKELAKMKGIPVEQKLTIMGAGSSGPNVGQAAKQAAKDEAVSAGAGAAIGRRLGGLGGLGGLGRRKKEDTPAQPAADAPPQPVVLMESVTTLSNFSSDAVDASKLAIPAGFKQEEHPLKKMAQQGR